MPHQQATPAENNRSHTIGFSSMPHTHSAGCRFITLVWLLMGGLLAADILTAGDHSMSPDNPNTDEQTLARLIELPYPATHLRWETRQLTGTESVPGPVDWALIAIISFGPEHFRQILADSPLMASSGSVGILPMNPSRIPLWVDSRLRLRLTEEPVSLSRQSTGARVRQANLFVKSPLLHGFILPDDASPQLFVYLYTQ